MQLLGWGWGVQDRLSSPLSLCIGTNCHTQGPCLPPGGRPLPKNHAPRLPKRPNRRRRGPTCCRARPRAFHHPLDRPAPLPYWATVKNGCSCGWHGSVGAADEPSAGKREGDWAAVGRCPLRMGFPSGFGCRCPPPHAKKSVAECRCLVVRGTLLWTSTPHYFLKTHPHLPPGPVL